MANVANEVNQMYEVNQTARWPVEASKPVPRVSAGHRLSVGEEGFEPSHPFGHTDLNRARLPFRHSP